MKWPRFMKKRLWTTGGIVRGLVTSADRLRDERRYDEAAALYREASRYRPRRADLLVQCGNMYKEAGRFEDAESRYVAAGVLMPGNADLALQLGHLYKLTGRFDEAAKAYGRALALKPRIDHAAAELAALRNVGWTDSGAVSAAYAETDGPMEDDGQRRTIAAAARGIQLQQDIFPRPASSLLHRHEEEIAIRRLGRPERTFWGTMQTLRGVEAIRGFAILIEPAVELVILLDGLAIHRGGFDGGFPLKAERDRPAELRKYVFNVWIDFAPQQAGRHQIEIRIVDVRRRVRSYHQDVVIAAPLMESDWPNLDGLVSLPSGDMRSVDEQINARPTMVRSARRALLADPPQSILVQRIDQLGDMVVSVPALRRLRELFPNARIVGLLSNANADLAKSLGLFDEVLITDFSEDWQQRRRIMAADRQEELAAMLTPYKFDMAIDMSENGWARRVLLLSGAKFLYGFRAGGDMPGLSVDLEGNTHDRLNGFEVVPHTNKMLGMMEWLGALARSAPNIVQRQAPSAAALATLGLTLDKPYAVLHDGARLQFSRWPYFNRLAAMILERTDLTIAMLIDDTADRDALPPDLVESDRVVLMPQRLIFDAFDALLANCSVFVGNDSGPKHLASLRGAQVVSIHSSRTNWNEWGQENTGFILSRKMPCAGCMVHYDPEECGRDFVCVRDITVEEVFGAVVRCLTPDAAPANRA